MKVEPLIIMQKQPKGEDDFHTFSIRIKKQLSNQLEAISAQTNRSRNELIGICLEFALQNCEIDKFK